MSSAENMDREDSAYSLPSERSADSGSHYAIESGFYISYFAAIFLASGITIVGVLSLSLVIALVAMIQSCENQKSSVFQHCRDNHVHDYCSIFASHMELNNLQSEQLPAVCKDTVNKYMNEGQYLLELNMSIQVVENYFSLVIPKNNLSVILMDADDLLPLHVTQKIKLPEFRTETENISGRVQGLVLKLYTRLQARGWSLVLFTRKPELWRAKTVEDLAAAGFEGWYSLIMRSNNELLMGSWEYISSRRMALKRQGLSIAGVISSQMDALTGPSVGKRNFKLPSVYWLRQRRNAEERRW